jgi:hypothetical protein
MRKLKKYHGWGIYKGKDDGGTIVYYVFLPGQSPDTCDYPEWEAGSIQEAYDFIDSY